jgi:hypothetical protein
MRDILAESRGATHKPQWGLKPRSAGSRGRVLRAPGSERGMIRLVQGVERSRSRRFAAQNYWNSFLEPGAEQTGMNIRLEPLAARVSALEAAAARSGSPPAD